MRGYVEEVNLARGRALVQGGMVAFDDIFPMGGGWHQLRIRISHAVTIGTGSGPIAQGELGIIKNIRFVTDLGEVICNLPGRAIYAMNTYKFGAPPRKDAIAAASATYRTTLVIPFTEVAGMGFMRPEDTLLDTSRYSSVTCEITLGTIADLFTSPGTASVVSTVDFEVVRTKGLLPAKAKPIGYVEYDQLPPVDASLQTFVLLKRAQDYAIKRLYAASVSGGTAGVPWSGTLADDVQDLEYIEDQSGMLIKDRVHQMIQEGNKSYRSLESIITGVAVHDFTQGQSIHEALVTVGKTLLQYRWSNQAGVASGDLVSVMLEGFRTNSSYRPVAQPK
jgi:hypothetical protein